MGVGNGIMGAAPKMKAFKPGLTSCGHHQALGCSLYPPVMTDFSQQEEAFRGFREAVERFARQAMDMVIMAKAGGYDCVIETHLSRADIGEFTDLRFAQLCFYDIVEQFAEDNDGVTAYADHCAADFWVMVFRLTLRSDKP